MEVFGAAASAIALAQLAISLAQSLNTYAGAVSDSVDDIVVIADDISDTYGNLQQLATVLEKNEKTKLLNEAAVDNAQRCVRKSEVLLRRLRKLFEKSGASSNVERVDPSQIDIGKFRKGMWIIYKSEFELRRAELHHIKADISLIYLTYLAMASGSDGSEKQKTIDQMKLVYAKRTVLDKDLKKARKRRDKDVEHQQDGRPHHSHLSNRPSYDDYDDDEEGDDDEPAVIYDKIEDLYSEFDAWLVLKQKKEQEAVEERKTIERLAVEEFLKQQEEAAQQSQMDMQKLRSTLTQHGLPPQRIDQIVKDAYPKGSLQPNVPSAPANGKKDPLSVGPTYQRSPSTTSSWFRRSSKRSDNETASNTSNDVPDILRDASAPGGIAQLKALYFQRVTVAPARYEIVKLEVAVPDFRLIPKLLSSGLEASQERSVSGFLQGFADIPEDYRYHITKEVELLQSESEVNWMILQVEPIKSGDNTRRFFKKRQREVAGVYIILRKVLDPDDAFARDDRVLTSEPENPVEAVSQAGIVASDKALQEPVMKSVAAFEPVPEHAEAYIMRGRNREDTRIPVYASHSARQTVNGSPSRPQRRTRFSESVEQIPSRASGARRTIYDSSDEESWRERRNLVYPAHQRSRQHVVNIMVPNEIRTPSVEPADSYRRPVRRESYGPTAEEYDNERDNGSRGDALREQYPLRRGPRIETELLHPDHSEGARLRILHDREMQRAQRTYSERSAPASAFRSRPTSTYQNTSRRHSYYSDNEDDLRTPQVSRGRDRRRVNRSSLVRRTSRSSSRSSSIDAISRTGRGTRSVPAEDAVQELLSEWTNPVAAPVATSKDSVENPESKPEHDSDEVEVIEEETEEESPTKLNSDRDKQPYNVPRVESDDSSRKHHEEVDKKLPNGRAPKRERMFT